MIFKVLSASDKIVIQDEVLDNQSKRYLTLTDKCENSVNRYHVCLTGKDAEIEWKVGDYIMLELAFCAYQQGSQWLMPHRSDSIAFVEIGIASEYTRTESHQRYRVSAGNIKTVLIKLKKGKENEQCFNF